MDSELPASIAGCRIVALCGRGAYGCVYLADDPSGHRCAIKLLTATGDAESELKGLRNYVMMGTPSDALVKIFFCGMDNGTPFYVMEAADNASDTPGEYIPDTLANRLKRHGRLPAAEALSICRSLLEGLECIHNAGLLHRDIKPENVIFINGQPKLADPGMIRSLQQTLSLAGTPGYIAPEVLAGKRATPSSDIYSLGKLLFHSATGLPPGEFPHLPSDLPDDILYQLCIPLLRLCNDAPEKRCRSCAECRAVLPDTMRKNNAWRRFLAAMLFRQEFRLRVFRTVLTGAAVVLFIALLAGCIGYFIRQRQLETTRQTAAVDATLQKLSSLEPTLNLQLARLNMPSMTELLAEPRAHRTAGRLTEAEEALRAVQSRLTSLAVDHLPTTIEGFLPAANAWGFLASPLGVHFLPKEQSEKLRARLQPESKQANNGVGFAVGKSLQMEQMLPFTAVFVPPGEFISPVLKSPQRIEYPYWIFANEISNDQFTEATSWPMRRSARLQAAEYLSWNEMLLYCRRANRLLHSNAFVPDGYGLRPPTEAEWEFAALGGWNGTIPASREIPQNSTCKAPGDGPQNSLGLRNMDDNVSELVIPYREAPLRPSYAFALRGSNYLKQKTDIESRIVYIPDQVFMQGGGGLRPVIAPIEQNFWEKQWFRGPKISPATLQDGTICVGWSVCHAVNWSVALALAKNLGGTLPEYTDTTQIDMLFLKLDLVPGFPIPLGIQSEQGGAWKRISDNAPASPAPDFLPAGEQTCLCGTQKRLMRLAPSMSSPSIAILWKNQRAFDARKNVFLHRAREAEFTVMGRRFVVCRVLLPGYMVRSFADFLGAKLPSFKSHEEITEVARNVPAELKQVAIGTCRFYDTWEQPDGSVFPLPSDQIPTPPGEQLNVKTARIHNILVISHQRVMENDVARYILLEE